MTKNYGSLYCMAPEFFTEDETSSFLVDVYAYECFLYRMFPVKLSLLNIKHPTGLIENERCIIQNGVFLVRLKYIPSRYWLFIQRCWC